MTVQHHYSVYGDAELQGNNTRVWPKQILVRQGLEIPDAWLILEGIQLEGVCVVGLVKTGRVLRYRTINWNPSPEPPGIWGSCSMTGGPARWRRIQRKTLWERLKAS